VSDTTEVEGSNAVDFIIKIHSGLRNKILKFDRPEFSA